MSFDPRPDQPDDNTAALARAVQAGDIGRFQALYDRLLPALYAWALVRVPRSKVSPEEFLQEVWCRAYQNLHTEAAENHEFRPWVFVIAKNCLLEVFRARVPVTYQGGSVSRSGIAVRVPDSTISAASRLGQDEALAKFLAFAGELDPVDRDLVVHCALEGRTCTAVAQQLGITADAAIKRWQRLRERLKALGWLRRLLLEED